MREEMGKKFSSFDVTYKESLKRTNNQKCFETLKPIFDRLVHAASEYDDALKTAEKQLEAAVQEVETMGWWELQPSN